MLTPNDIRNPKRKSGFNRVSLAGGRGRGHGGGLPWCATLEAGARGALKRGPRRATAEEAAQDYCDYMNGLGNPRKPRQPRKVGSLTVSLRGAGHAAHSLTKGARRRGRGGSPRLGYVYCISEEDMHTAVKVGYSQDATLRIGALQTGNPRKLVILGVLRGTEADERELHAEYIDQNILGEWFRPTPALLSEFGIEKEMIA